MVKRLIGSPLKFLGLMTIIGGIAIASVFLGFMLYFGAYLFLIGLFIYFVDWLVKRAGKAKYRLLQISLSITYILLVGWQYMSYQEHTDLIFPDNFKGSAGIIFGIKGYPELPGTHFWRSKVTFPKNGIIITSTLIEDMPEWQQYYYANGARPKEDDIHWEPEFAYNCVIGNSVVKAWLFNVHKDTTLSVQKVIVGLSNQINKGRLKSLYTALDNVIVTGRGGKYLYLQGAGIAFLPDAVAGLDISTVYLAQNNFTTIPKQLYSIKSLHDIYLSRNPIKELPADLYKIKSLKSLSVSATQIRGIKADLSKLDSLEDLDVSENRLSVFPEHIKDIPHLRSLSIQDNSFKDLSFIDNRLQKLETLHIFSNGLKGIAGVRYLTNLKELLIFDNQLESIPDEIAALRQLEKLEIWDNPIRRISPEISKLTNLKELRLDDDYLTGAGKEKLQRWLPNCTIHYQTSTHFPKSGK